MTKDAPKAKPRPSISALLGVDRVLPGEDRDAFAAGLEEFLASLEVPKSSAAGYLGELVYEQLWWLKRYGDLKQELFLNAMLKFLGEALAEAGVQLSQPLTQKLFDPAKEAFLQDLMKTAGWSLGSLRNQAFLSLESAFADIDQSTELTLKNLAKLQGNLDLWLARAPKQKLLRLEIERRQRDLAAIEGQFSAPLKDGDEG